MARRSDLEIALQAIVAAALPSVSVVFERQEESAAPRPVEPYATVRVPTSRRLSGTYHDTLTDTPDGDRFVRRLQALHRGTMRVDVYGEGAADIAESLDIALRGSDRKEQARSLGVTICGAVSIIDGTELQDSTWQRRAQIDFSIHYHRRDESLREYAIETLDLTLET